MPQRPVALNQAEKARFDQCEREYSACKLGRMPVDEHMGTDPKSDQPQRYDNYFGSSSSCNRELKKCYAQKLEKVAP